MKDITKYSNPKIVFEKAKRIYGNDVDIKISTHKNKKYMIRNPEGKYIHFGQLPYEDYTKHKDKERRDKFLKRNKKWANSDKYSPSFMAYYILW